MHGGKTSVDDGFRLKRLVGLLFRYKLMIALVFLGGTGIGGFAAFLFVRPMSVIDGTKMIALRNPEIALRGMAGEVPGQTAGEIVPIEAHIAQLLDEETIEEVVRRTRLDAQEEGLFTDFLGTNQGRAWQWIARTLSSVLGPDSPLNHQPDFFEDAVWRLKQDLVLKPASRNARASEQVALTIQYSNVSAEKTVEVIDSFIAVCRERKNQAFLENPFLKKQEELSRKRWDEISARYEEKRTELRTKYEALGLPFEADLSVALTGFQGKLLQLEGRESQIKGSIRQAKAQISLLEDQLNAALAASRPADAPAPPDDAAELAKLTALNQALQTRIVALNVELVASDIAAWKAASINQELKKLLEQRDEAERRIQRLHKNLPTPVAEMPAEAVRIQRELAREKGALEEYEKELAEVKKEKATEAEEEGELRRTLAAVGVLRSDFQSLSEHYEYERQKVDHRTMLAAVREDFDCIEDVTSRVELAEKPRSAHRWGRGLLTLAAALHSLALGCALALALGLRFDTSFSSLSDVEQSLGVPVIAVVPQVRRRLLRRLTTHLQRLSYVRDAHALLKG